MAKFTVRVELHSASHGDYEKLHLAMADRGLSRTIFFGGTNYYLPTAEYITPMDATGATVMEAAKAAVDTLGKSAAVLVTQAVDWLADGLAEAQS